MTAPTYNDPAWHLIANCDHAAFDQADSPLRPLEQCPSCHVFLRTITTDLGWAEHAGEMRRDDLLLRDVDYDRAADDYYEKRWTA